MMDPHASRRLDRLDTIARRMDSAFRIPGTRIRLGWDSLLGLIPGLGDAAALTPAAWIMVESHRLGAPRHLLLRQGLNVAVDALVGTVPLIGDLFDVGFKANRRNVSLLRDHLERHSATGTAEPAPGDGALSSHHPTIGGETGAGQPVSSDVPRR